uniref:Sushi domain-containing protein n=1 Tax=Gopherus evgoodei TaxID=1825980 RepID=A0A8C4W6D8_9SAUR
MALYHEEIPHNMWVLEAGNSVRPCDYPHIENGALTEYYEYYKERAFPAQLGVGIYYRCLDGYVSEREERWPLIRCTKVGWSPAPKCLKKCSPGYLENGRFLSSYWNTYKEGDEISYVCSTHNLETRVTCTKNGWSPTPTCTSTKCEMLTLSKGSVFPLKGKYNNGDVVTFSCAKSHKRVGPDSSQCYYFGWFPASPTCKEETKACGEPPSITNGNIISELHENYQHGDSVEYDCDRSFKIIGSRKIECIDGEWTSLPSCTEEEKTCGLPPSITKGKAVNIDHQQYIHGDTVEYECEKNYEMVGPKTVKCLSGEWISLPSCADQSATCALPDNFENIIILQTATSKKSYRHKASIKYKCKTDGTNFIQTICKYGEWTPKIDCIGKRCPPPPQLPGAIKITETRNYASGEKIAFTCLEHFEHQGVKEIMCENGKWQSPPHCVEMQCTSCGPPPIIDNGDTIEFVQQVYESGLAVQYKCKSLHVMRGSQFVRCESGQWTDPPVCLEPCTASPEDMEKNNIELKWREATKLYSESGDFIEFDCKQGYERDPISSALRVQCMEGKLAYPKCKEKGK